MFVKTEERPQGEVHLDEASKLLLQAADYIEQHGWSPRDTGGACASNAMVWALHGRNYYGEMSKTFWDATMKFASALGSNNCATIFRWNDAPERTKEEVIAKLREVAYS